MTSTTSDPPTQAANGQPDRVTLARQLRFPNLCASGILRRREAGPPIDPGELETALNFLRRCRRVTRPTVHSHDLQHRLGVSPGAIIAAAVVLNFDVRGRYGVKAFYPHALVAVSRFDVRKQISATGRLPHGA